MVDLSSGRRSRRRRGDGEAGYNLVILSVTITVMTIMLAAALPLWSHMIKRDREEELRFRGLQYAEAIRVFQARFGRYPTRLQELMEVKPRSIRQLWRDPVSKSGEWGLVIDVGKGGTNLAAGAPLQAKLEGAGDDGGFTGIGADKQEGADVPFKSDLFSGDDKDAAKTKTVTVGPIRGVFSLSTDESIGVFMGQTSYRQWVFTADLLQGGLLQRAAAGKGIAPGIPVFVRMDWIGRPFRQFLNQKLPPGGTGLGPGSGVGPGGGGGGGGAKGTDVGGGGGFPSGDGGFPGGSGDENPSYPTDGGKPTTGTPSGGGFPGGGIPGGGVPGGGRPSGGTPGGRPPGGRPPTTNPPGGGGGGGTPQPPPSPPGNDSVTAVRPSP